MAARIVSAVVIVAVAAAVAVASWPALFGLQRVDVVAQVVALRGLGILVAAAVAILVAVAAVLASGRLRGTLAAVLVLLLAFCGVGLAVLAGRGFGGPATAPAPATRQLTVMAWNTLGDAPGAERIAQVALDAGADVVVLPETSTATARQVAARMAAQGRPMAQLGRSLDLVAKARTTSLLISTTLGAYAVDETAGSTPTLPSLVARPVGGSGPVIVAAHPISPTPGETDHWRAGLDWLANACPAGQDTILAGDLNATLDHFQGLGTAGGDLGACRDAARAAGAGALGTWPVQLPEMLAAPIDHVMATSGWTATAVQVIGAQDAAGSDHRPIVARLRAAS